MCLLNTIFTHITADEHLQVFSLGLGAIVILANVKYGWDRHIWDVALPQYQDASIIAFAAKIIFTFAATFTRISLICFYFRLVRDSGHTKFRGVLWSAMAWQIAVCISFVLLVVFLCRSVCLSSMVPHSN